MEIEAVAEVGGKENEGGVVTGNFKKMRIAEPPNAELMCDVSSEDEMLKD